ncbi:hypothetical protein F5X71_16335 [Nocardia brasiliensis]|uniref:Excalibur calcium-binding domain-containing protein n=1 Tax=Nocardia brasiliensis TaxID=37326 RepID=A0A6G9XS47_NOCBR|nr:hypothetical protein F5X71_16335 [Nocardia brasiliensis]
MTVTTGLAPDLEGTKSPDHRRPAARVRCPQRTFGARRFRRRHAARHGPGPKVGPLGSFGPTARFRSGESSLTRDRSVGGVHHPGQRSIALSSSESRHVMTTTPRQCAVVALLIAGISLGAPACGSTSARTPTVHPSSTSAKPTTPSATPTLAPTPTATPSPTATLSPTTATTTSTFAPAPIPRPAAPPSTTVAAPQRFVPPPPPAPAPQPTVTPPPAPSTYYSSCAAARAAGAAPLHRGEPGYRSGLDRDGDGVACE